MIERKTRMQSASRPRILILDETHLGHHGTYAGLTVRAVEGLAGGGSEVLYAVPRPIEGSVSARVPFRHPESLPVRALRHLQALSGRPWYVAAKWRWLQSLVTRHSIDRLFLLDGDLYLHPDHLPTLSCDWVPLYMHPRFLRTPATRGPVAALRDKRCRFIYVLDDGIRDDMAAVTGKPIFKFPDLADGVVEPAPDLVDPVLLAAAGRRIVGVFGAISPHKNVGRICDVARRRPDLFFVIAGIPFFHKLPREECDQIEAARTLPNVKLILEYVADRRLNHLHEISDVLLAPYVEFPHSANRLTKAAFFRKPLVVSKGYYMAEVVDRYGMGVACDPLVLDSLDGAISRALTGDWTQARWDEYLAHNDVAALRTALQPLVDWSPESTVVQQ